MTGPAPSKPIKVLVRRHGVTTRITHWVNALSLGVLLFSGLQIFNAHPGLYWGQQSDFAHPWLAMVGYEQGGQLHGVTRLGGQIFDTTGFLGASKQNGVLVARGFPAWLTGVVVAQMSFAAPAC